MKKLPLLVLSLIALLTLGAGCFTTTVTVQSNENVNATAQEELAVSLSIDRGDASPVRTFTKNVASGATALDLLRTVSEEDNVPMETKDYDFGTLVTAVDGVSASDSKFWSFYVNNALAPVGAGDYVLKQDDAVLFRFASAQ